ncbi:MAG: hypothetical protein QOC68_2703 [Solirubrobacteraceae bacterium]|jgi:hypothetical protein|nr:hypothetical protein [Solirubrobacteraceae bacterium]
MRCAPVVLMLAASALALSGCRYGQYSDVDLQASVKALQSIAAEGSLMANDAARGRSMTTFMRTHGQDLSDQAEHEAEKMSDAPLAPGIEKRVAKAISLASDIGSSIDDLRVNPRQRKAAVTAAKDLQSYARQVQQLGGSG